MAVIICPVVANSEPIDAGIGVAIGLGISVEIGNDVETGVALAVGDLSPALGVEVLVGVNEEEVVGAGVGDNEVMGEIVSGDEAAATRVGDAVGVGADSLPAIAITLSRSPKASSYCDSRARTLALSYNVAGFSPFDSIAWLYSVSASVFLFCLANSRPCNQ